MNTQVKRMTCVMSSVISFNPLQRLASKPLPKSTLQRQLGKLQNVPTANHICWSGTQRTLTSIRSVNNYEHQWKAYSTQSSNQKPAGETETDEADRQSGRVSEQLGSETHCSSTDDMTRGGTMNDYVRKASLAREKMKEKMADTVKDMVKLYTQLSSVYCVSCGISFENPNFRAYNVLRIQQTKFKVYAQLQGKRI